MCVQPHDWKFIMTIMNRQTKPHSYNKHTKAICYNTSWEGYKALKIVTRIITRYIMLIIVIIITHYTMLIHTKPLTDRVIFKKFVVLYCWPTVVMNAIITHPGLWHPFFNTSRTIRRISASVNPADAE